MVPGPEAAKSDRVIFEPINIPLERFQKECVANLMECVLTADSAASARELGKVLESLTQGKVFVQDDPSLRRLIELAATAREIRWSSQGAPEEKIRVVARWVGHRSAPDQISGKPAPLSTGAGGFFQSARRPLQRPVYSGPDVQATAGIEAPSSGRI